MTNMSSICGLNYHWLHELLQLMGLPILNGVEAVLKQANVKRSESLEQRKSKAERKKEASGISTQGARTRCPRKSQNVVHTYNKNAKSVIPLPPKMSRDSLSIPTRPTRKQGICKCTELSFAKEKAQIMNEQWETRRPGDRSDEQEHCV